jgi:hypothetical protein
MLKLCFEEKSETISKALDSSGLSDQPLTLNCSISFVVYLSFTGFKGPRRADKQVDVLSTVETLSQQSSTSINALIEEEHLHFQSATPLDQMTTSIFSLGERHPHISS